MGIRQKTHWSRHMSNPKDWFRRRHREMLRQFDGEDPFAKDSVLELGHSASVVPLGRLDPLAPSARRSDLPKTEGEELRIPPPPMRQAGLRSARVIDSQAFTVRPEIVRTAPRRAPVSAPSASGL